MLKKRPGLTRLFITVIASGLLIGAPTVSADIYQQQIDSLNAQNAQAQNSADNLGVQAASYQDEINQLQVQISTLQDAINTNQNKQNQIQAQIQADQDEITQEKQTLANVIHTMYVSGQVSTVEILASSKNISDFVDAETYRSAVSNEIQNLVTKISNLEDQLKQQNAQLQIVINTESQQNAQLTANEQKQQSLLAYTQAQQDAYNQQIQSNQSRIAVLRAEQIAANKRLLNGGGSIITTGSCGGTYPASAVSPGGTWGCDYPLDNTIDNWGMYNRECVSYTAWMVYENYGYMPYWGGSGNANEWPANAEAAGIPIGSTPKVGSVAIYMGGAGDPFGHAMWVVGVSGNMITVDQYNLYYDGNFYETTINGSGLTYIYFGG